MKILGIDPGTKRVGWGVVEKEAGGKLKMLDCGCIESKKKNIGEVLEDIDLNLSKIIKKYKPDSSSIEKLFFFKNQKTVIEVSQARGVILLACQKENLPIFEPTPLEIKTCVAGYGRADKKAVGQMIKRILNLEKVPRLDDTADALAAAATAFFHIKNKN